MGYGYDLGGNLTSLTYPDSSKVTRSYDAANRLTGISDWLGHTTSFAYDPNSNLVTQTYPNSTTASFSYDAADQLNQITEGPSGSQRTFGYTRDALGQVVTANDPLQTIQHTYSNDPLNRLTGDQRSNGTTASYSYDAADQLNSATDSSTTTSSTWTYDVAHELTGFQTTTTGSTTKNLTLSYNGNGDRTGQTDSIANTQTAFGYDQADRLISFAQGSTTSSYRYNGDGLRMSKTVNGTTSIQVWDLAEGMPVMIQDGSTRYITGPDGLPIEQVDGSGSCLYYYQDQLGSTRELRDGSGNSVATYTHDPYGTLTSSTGSVTTPFGYAGQYTDSESGLQYLRARYYDPSTDQFLTVDPLAGVTGEVYAYANGDPIDLTDPSGLFCFGPIPVPRTGDSLTSCGSRPGHALGSALRLGRTGLHYILDLAAVPPYAMYYEAYEEAKYTNSPVIIVAAPFPMPMLTVQAEAEGLGADVVIDWIKGHTVNQEQPNDEGIVGGILPRFIAGGGPRTYLPGWHVGQPCTVDFWPFDVDNRHFEVHW